ncbi:MAG: DinB family protein [Terriglobia bacterium]
MARTFGETNPIGTGRRATLNPSRETPLGRQFLDLARHSIEAHHFPEIARCLEMLSEEEIWWRPNAASNSVGNLVLHLSGNLRQWIISGLGGQPDTRHREQEFSEKGPLAKRVILSRLRTTVKEAGQVISSLTAKDLTSLHHIQGFKVSGLQAVSHVLEHFAFHTGQIVYLTKMKVEKDLGFTRLPGEKRGKPGPKPLPIL